MSIKTKINLGVIVYGNVGQRRANSEQFEFLRKELRSFKLRQYYFDERGKARLVRDFKLGRLDFVLKNAYGRGNENNIEVFLEQSKIPFLGSGSFTTFIGTSKFLSKCLFGWAGLNSPSGELVNNLKQAEAGKFRFSVIVKADSGTDSRGIQVAHNQRQLRKQLVVILKKYKRAVVEEYLSDAEEATCMVVGNEDSAAYEPVLLKTSAGFISKKQKDRGGIVEKIPSGLDKRLIKKIQTLAMKAHIALGCKTFSRSDILIKNNKLYLLEVDVHPGFREASPTTLSARHAGQTMDELFILFCQLAKGGLR